MIQFSFFFSFFWLRWVFIAARRLSPVGASGATLRCGARASHCGGFSCCRARALGVWASAVMAPGLSCSAACGMWDVPEPGIETVTPAFAGGFLTTAPPGESPTCGS